MTLFRICAAVAAVGFLACASVDPRDVNRANMHRRIHGKRGNPARVINFKADSLFCRERLHGAVNIFQDALK